MIQNYYCGDKEMNEFMLVTVISNSRLNNNVLLISKDMAVFLGLETNRTVQFFVGQYQRTLELNISNSEKNKQSITLNPVLIKRLYLRSGWKYGIRSNDDEIHIGPVVGIMAEVFNETDKPFGGQSFFIQQLLVTGRRLGEMCFAFSPYSINWNKNTIHGYSYGKNGWSRVLFPIPDVIYPREKAYSPSKLRIRKRLATKGAKFINPPLIGKWETYQRLIQNPNLVPFLPDTRLIKSFRQLDSMINKYRAVYLKPVSGSQGKNIIKVVKKKSSSTYQYQYQMNNQLHRGSTSSITKLRSSLKRVMGNRRYIIQKQINLIRSKGNILDVRILVQKDSSGEWGVTGMACRVGKNGSITSNISSGGSGRKLESVLQGSFSDEAQRADILENIKFVAIEAAKTLEESIGQAGEMGIDIGIDKNGQIWFIEANLRPARQVFTLIGEKQIRQKSVEKPMLYAKYLAEFL